jgi:hypothetical protein
MQQKQMKEFMNVSLRSSAYHIRIVNAPEAQQVADAMNDARSSPVS